MHHLSVSWHIIPLKFSDWKIIYFGQEEPIKIQFFRLLSAIMKAHLIPHAVFETTRSEFIYILHHWSESGKITPCIFYSWNLTYFRQIEPIKVKFSGVWLLEWKFIKLLMSYLKPQLSFSLKFAALYCFKGDKNFVSFLQGIQRLT